MERMPDAKIQEILEEERSKFNNALYEGSDLPKDLIELLKKTLFRSTGRMLQQPQGAAFYKTLINKPVKKLTNFEVAVILNVIKTGTLAHLFSTIEIALDRLVELDTLTISYNLAVQSFEKALEQKEILLSGRKTPRSGNPNMSIIQPN